MASNSVGVAKGTYLRMAKRMKVGSPELEAFEKERKFERKKTGMREAAAKELADIQLEARKHTAQILEGMVDIATDPSEMSSARISAANFVYDRAYGKAAQTNINANVNTNGKPSEITGSALTKRIEATLKRIEELTSGGSTPPASSKGPDDVCERDRDPNSPTKH